MVDLRCLIMVETRQENHMSEPTDSALGQLGPLTARPWRHIWQAPLLLAGLAVFILGLYTAAPEPPVHDFEGRLDDLQHCLEAGLLDRAQAISDQIEPYLPTLTPELAARLWQYTGDLRYFQLKAAGPFQDDNPSVQHARQVIINCYLKAEKLGRELDPLSVRKLARTYCDLGRIKEALELSHRFEQRWQRVALLREIIEQQRFAATPNAAATRQALIAQFNDEARQLTDSVRRREQQLWIATYEAQIAMDHSDFDAAIGLLLRKLQQLGTGEKHSAELAPLYVILAQAYQSAGRLDDAQRYYDFTLHLLDPHDALRAEALVGLGWIALTEPGDEGVSQATETFSEILERYPSEPAAVEAAMGLGDALCRQQHYARAIEHFGQAIASILRSPRPKDSRLERLNRIIQSHVQRCMEYENYHVALDLLTLLRPVYEKGLPPIIQFGFASIEQKLAESYIDRAKQLDPRKPSEEQTPEQITRARELVHQKAAMHYERAARNYLAHAQQVSAADDQQHAESLWLAANCFDHAQIWDRAIDAYKQLATTRRDDSDRNAAIKKLALAYMACGQEPTAIEYMNDLLLAHPNSPHALALITPLAKCYQRLDRLDDAERALLSVVEDHSVVTPDSDIYRDALVELGQLYIHRGASDPAYFLKAIESIDTALQHYSDQPVAAKLHFELGEALRQSVPALDDSIKATRDPRKLRALGAERDDRLRRAQAAYATVVQALDQVPSAALTPLEQLYLRSSDFYQAHAAFDRRDFETAIDLYDRAARRWASEPSSLIALVQIVNARCELGQFDEARIANRHARDQLQSMPDQAFADDPTMPMSRQQWEDWLRWTGELELALSREPAVAEP